MDRHSDSYTAAPLIRDSDDQHIINPFGSGPVAREDEAQFVGRKPFDAEPLMFRKGTSASTAKSIQQYAQIFGGGSVQLQQQGDQMMLVLMERRDRQLLLDQFGDHLIG